MYINMGVCQGQKMTLLTKGGGGEESKEIKVLHMTLDFACVHDFVLGRTFLSNFFPKNASLSLFAFFVYYVIL